jgi:hypothetical protein
MKTCCTTWRELHNILTSALEQGNPEIGRVSVWVVFRVHTVTPVRNHGNISARFFRIHLQKFDGSLYWILLHLQFKTIAEQNDWTDWGKAIALLDMLQVVDMQTVHSKVNDEDIT